MVMGEKKKTDHIGKKGKEQADEPSARSAPPTAQPQSSVQQAAPIRQPVSSRTRSGNTTSRAVQKIETSTTSGISLKRKSSGLPRQPSFRRRKLILSNDEDGEEENSD